MQEPKLRYALLGQFSAAVLVPLLLIGMVVLHLLTQQIEHSLQSENRLLVQATAEETRSFLQQTGKVMEEAAFVWEQPDIGPEAKLRLLDNLVATYPFLDMLQIVDAQGVVRQLVPAVATYQDSDVSGQDFFRQALAAKQMYWSPPFISLQTGQVAMTAAYPLKSGRLVAYINLRELVEICQRRSLPDNQWLGIVDRYGVFIGHVSPEKVYQRAQLAEWKHIADRVEQGEASSRIWYQGKEAMVSATRIPETDWMVMVFQSTEAALAPVQTVRNIFLFGTLLAVLLGLGLAVWTVQPLLKPLRLLLKETAAVAAGRYPYIDTEFEYQEPRLLARSFNTMVTAIQSREAELEAQQAELSRYMEELQQRNRELDQFAYIVSHDLKAPLRAIANLALWLEEDHAAALDAEMRQKIELMQGRVRRMQALIEGLLEYSRIGRVQGRRERIDSGAVVREVVADIVPSEQFTVILPEEWPQLIGERLRLQQVFSNLISNAVKHHDKAYGYIAVHWLLRGEYAEFTVKDDGPGIAPEYQEKIFEVFQTLQPRDRVESTGIGLALVRKIVREVGGEVTLVSQVGEGAAFRFSWPLDTTA